MDRHDRRHCWQCAVAELIRLAAEYLTAGLRFDPHRMSHSLSLIEPEPDDDFGEWGLRLQYDDPYAAGSSSYDGLYSALADLPLAAVGSGTTAARVSWRVYHNDGRERLVVGVLCPDAVLSRGVDSRAYALQLTRGDSDSDNMMEAYEPISAVVFPPLRTGIAMI
jgi:hypothetical protein